MKKSKAFLFVSLIFPFMAVIFSCADASPKVTSVSAFSIIEFNDEENFPEYRFSVFTEVSSAVQRASSITVENEETGLSWKADCLRKATDGSKKQWAGYGNFCAPKGRKVPVGKYLLTYTDFAGEQWEGSFKISYSEDFLNSRAGDFPDAIKVSKVERIVLYDSNGDLLFYGDLKKEWADKAKLLSEYPDAVTARNFYYISSMNTVVVMPERNLLE